MAETKSMLEEGSLEYLAKHLERYNSRSPIDREYMMNYVIRIAFLYASKEILSSSHDPPEKIKERREHNERIIKIVELYLNNWDKLSELAKRVFLNAGISPPKK